MIVKSLYRTACSLFIIAPLLAVFLCACTNSEASKTMAGYNYVLLQVQNVEQELSSFDVSSASAETIKKMNRIAQELSYDYNPSGLNQEQLMDCERLKGRVNQLKRSIIRATTSAVDNFQISVWSSEGVLFEERQSFPIYLKKGERLNYRLAGEMPMNVKVRNADSRVIVKSTTNKTSVDEEFLIPFSAIYTVEIEPQKTQYVTGEIFYKVSDLERLTAPTELKIDQVECTKDDYGAKGVPGINMRKCFEEPRKFTLRGQIKAAFSGNSRGLVAVNIPAGATDILYSLRVSTSEQDRSSDGKFHNNLAASYKKIKFLGIPVYERTSSSGILNMLLDDNRPLCDGDAYCNMYVFRNSKEAKQYQDGVKTAAQLSYDVNYSSIGTQSCSGRIPVNGSKTIYLAFENERMRYTNYLWVEVEAVVPTTVYYTTKYTL